MLFSILPSLSTARRALCTQDMLNKYVLAVTLAGRQDLEGSEGQDGVQGLLRDAWGGKLMGL